MPENPNFEPNDRFDDESWENLDSNSDSFPILNLLRKQCEKRIGCYIVLGELAKGGMGTVYKVSKGLYGEELALKLVPVDETSDRLDRFVQEMAVLTGLNHSNIIGVRDRGKHEGSLYFVMDFCKQGTLAQRLSTKGINPPESADIVYQLSQGIQHAHDAGVVHRDLKPSNVLIGDHGLYMISDFGIAQCREQFLSDSRKLTKTGHVVGTPSYMAPEQAQGQKYVGPAVDIYALGAILYECITGRPPFSGKTTLETMKQVCELDPIAPRRLDPSIPVDLETICLKCLEKLPSQRYLTATELGEDLTRFLNGRPILARPPGFVAKMMKLAIRSPKVTALLGLLALVTVISFALVVGLWWHADQKAWEANQRAKEEKLAREEKDGLSAKSYLSSGITRLQSGHFEHGMIWLTRALEIVPSNETTIQRSIRINLAGWFPTILPKDPLLHQLSNVSWAALGKDGKRVVTTSFRGDVRLWELESGKPVGPEIIPFELSYNNWRLETYHSPDLRTVLAIGIDSRSVVIDLETGKRTEVGFQLKHLPSDTHFRRYFHCSPDLKHAAISDQTGIWRYFKVPSGEVTGEAMEHSGSLGGRISLDSRFLLTLGGGGTCKLWEIPTGKLLCAKIVHPGLTQAIFSPDNKHLVTVSGDETGRIWELPSGKRGGDIKVGGAADILHTLVGNPSVYFSQDGKLIATGGKKGGKVLAIPGGKKVIDLQDQNHIHCIAFTNDNKYVATGSCMGTIQLWDLSSGEPLGNMMREQGGIAFMQFTPDNNKLLTTSQNGGITIWDLATNKPIAPPQSSNTWKLDHPGPVLSFCLSADGLIAASLVGTTDGEIRIWNVSKREMVQVFKLNTEHKGGEGSLGFSPRHLPQLRFSPDGKSLLAYWVDGVVRVWDVRTWKQIGLPIRAGDKEIVDAGFRSDNKTLLIGNDNGTITTFPVGRDALLGTAFIHQHLVAMTVSPSGTLSATTGIDGMVQIRDLKSSNSVRSLFRHRTPVRKIVFSPDEQVIATGGNDGVVRFWDIKSGQERQSSFRCNFPIETLAFSPDGKKILAGGGVMVSPTAMNGFAVLWDLESEVPLGQPFRHLDMVTSAVFSKDGSAVYTGSLDFTVRKWVLPSPIQGTPEEIKRQIQKKIGKDLGIDGILRDLKVRR